jgi:hypothetical protein
MSKPNLPTYAVVELLMRLSQHNLSIGDYKNHFAYDTGVIVKTSRGTICFPEALIKQQFEDPDLVTDNALLELALSFNPVQ